ncbi:MAG TPA: DUF6541 family protein [Blastococcus sp.]|nr:DUF6541 family protein [Blastococcus sp.]
MDDHLLLVCGALLLYVPGVLFLLVCRVRRLPVLVGMAPAVTIGVLQLAALLRAVIGTGLGVTTAAVLALLGAVTVAAEVRAGAGGIALGALRSTWRALRGAPLTSGLSAAFVGAAAWLGTTSWIRGFHGLATPPQEHDTVQHTLITAYIAHTGHAGPFEVMPTDLATGANVNYYPAGAHTFAGLLSMVSGNPVSGLNATTALILGFAAPVTLFAALSAFEALRTRPVFSALAVLVGVTLYRPYFELAHDAGILAFGMGVALCPAVAVGLAALRPRDRGMPVALGVTALGLFAIHPSVAVIAVLVLAVVALVGLLSWPPMRLWLRERSTPLAATALAAAVLTAPWLVASVSVAGSVASYPEAPPSLPLGVILRVIALFNYGGFIESGQPLYQETFSVLFWVGFVGCLTSRRLWPLVAAWLFWAVAATLFATGHAGLPGLAQIGGLFYNSWTRIVSVVWALSPAVAGLGIAALVSRLVGMPAVERRRLRPAAVAVVAVVLAAGFFAKSGVQYARTNAHAVAERYGAPAFYRVSPIEHEAFDYLAQHRSGVGRVLNNGNDGSTFLYVYDAIPVVNTYPLGMVQEEYGIYLMEHFNEIGTNDVVRCLVQRYDITDVITSVSSPRIPSFAAPGHWVTTPTFDYAPGFRNLQDVPQVRRVFTNPDTTIYQIDPAIVAGHDEGACTSDPAHPLASDPPR